MIRSAAQLIRLFHTVRHLHPGQVTNRLRRTVSKPRLSDAPAPPLRVARQSWVPPALRPASLLGPSRFRVFHDEIDVLHAADWQDPKLSHLCQYNLHYFDDLRAQSAEQRTTWHRALIDRWVDENPPLSGPGWEPYPLSLRIVNWIQWALAGNELTAGQRDSLAKQVRCLSQQLEFHLLANHLFANAKALLFAGAFFRGQEAEQWLTQGSRLLEQEVREQILRDGGHFELSPMYHSLILEDLLDVLHVGRLFPDVPQLAWVSSLPETLARMRRWLKVMTHPDGQIALFQRRRLERCPCTMAARGVCPSAGA